MKKSLRRKITYLFAAGLLLALLNLAFVFSSEVYNRNQDLFIERAGKAAEQLAHKTDSLLQLGLLPDEFVGYDVLCQEVVTNTEGVVYTALLDKNGHPVFQAGNLPSVQIRPEYRIQVPLQHALSNGSSILLMVDDALIYQQTASFVKTTLLYSAIISLAVILATMYFLRVNLGKPLQSLLDHIQAAKYERPPNLEWDVRNRRDELGIIAEAFDETFAQLTQSQEKLAQSNYELLALTEELEQRVTARTQELEAAYEKLDSIAHVDALTGLLNRLSFDKALEQRFEHAKRNKHTFAVLVADLDGFKEVNDTYGHAAGDFALKTIGQRIRHSFREGDSIFRIGGDEFVFILEEFADRFALDAFVQKIRDAVLTPILLQDARLPIGVSIGIACAQSCKACNAHALLKLADDSMYEAKNKGLSHVFCDQTDIPPSLIEG